MSNPVLRLESSAQNFGHRKNFHLLFQNPLLVYTRNGFFVYLIGFVFSQVLAWIIIKSAKSMKFFMLAYLLSMSLIGQFTSSSQVYVLTIENGRKNDF